jgi:dienelactone hydrolase
VEPRDRVDTLMGRAPIELAAVPEPPPGGRRPGGATRAFYDPPGVAPARSGALIRTAPYAGRWLPRGVVVYRILYTTTREEGRPTVASGLVLVPESAVGPRGRPADVVVWAHGVAGIDPASAPSARSTFRLTRLQRDLIAAGWAIVAPDYVGLGTPGPHPLLIGEPTARSVLDAARAAREISRCQLSDATVICGYSQGGHAALWAGAVASSYAPELEIRGVAALAPVTQLADVVKHVPAPFGSGVLSCYFFDAYAQHYPDVTYEEYILPEARDRVRRTARHGLRTLQTTRTAVVDGVIRRPIWNGDPDRGVLRQRMAENIPAGLVRVPVLLAHGTRDRIVPAASQDEFVRSRRADGQAIDYRTYPCDHDGPVRTDTRLIADVVDWTRERLLA